jgi:hypothetical protein
MLLILFFYLSAITLPQSKTEGNQMHFEKYFSDKTMRIDYFHIGDLKSELITIDKIYQYDVYSGNRRNLIDSFNNGKYYVKIYDGSSGELIFSKGFDTYFGEYQTSSDGENGKKRTYHESAIIPYPKSSIKFSIEKRDDKNLLKEIFKTEIDPGSISIIKDKIKDASVKVYQSLKNGDPGNKVDVAVIGEGYIKDEESKFQSDLDRFTQIFFKQEPYKSYKNRFNVYGIFKASEESGVDEPDAGIFKNTVLNATFNSLGSERYLLTEDNKTLRDLAAHVPYDAIYIMVNHKRYGGGGIYNWVCTFTADNQWSEYLFLHEFGHSFAGLADEYYTSDVAYNEFFKKTVEPVEPNITALLNPADIKWKDKLTSEIQIPTPWNKKDFDSLDYKWQAERRELNKRIAELKREKKSKDEIVAAEEEYNLKDKKHSEMVNRFLKKDINSNKVGAFEGAGYSQFGLYRPMIDCIMFSKAQKNFCKVCEEAIIEVIKFYSE